MVDREKLLYQVWLSQCCGGEPNKVHKILKKFGSARAAYEANHYTPEFYRELSMADTLRLVPNLDEAEKFLKDCENAEIQVISIEDTAYPERLKQVYHPPQILYVKGNLPDLNRLACIAVVGTRKCTPDGRKFAIRLGRELAETGFAVVSGMALGTDGAAHCGALEAGGTTLAVLAGGVDLIYPTEHAKLYKHILTHGAVLSERPPGTRGKPYFYQQRNRIIVGLSLGVAVVEGEEKSGTSITARLAQECNRDVFAVPGNPENPYSVLPNELIQDGAVMIKNALDITEEYIGLYPEMLEYGIGIKGKPVVGRAEDILLPDAAPELQAAPPKSARLSIEEAQQKFEQHIQRDGYRELEQVLLRCLWNAGDKMDFDMLAGETGLEAPALSSTLIILQMKKVIAQSAGGQYTLLRERFTD